MLLSKPMKTKSDEMKGEKEKIKASSKKEGFPWGTDWQRGFQCLLFLLRIKTFIFLRKWMSGASEVGDGYLTTCLKVAGKEWYHAKLKNILVENRLYYRNIGYK